ncbi:type VI secretion system ATPase TssH [Chitinilyticum litopenaei]|uniref:type VI secretion system ATPase TssH n=1 Tax=Chitinilyticum litopenaei TaxID=1121276 RepID=UPI000686036A|nr:type VI secretion system ATPase TssH [Chitinilyticum litopenaei]
MSKINRSELFGRLNSTLFQSLESATRFARYRNHARVELAHWLNLLLQLPNSDVHLVATAAGIDLARLSGDVTEALNRLPQQDAGIDFAPELEHAVERGWIYASLKFRAARIRGAHLLLALLEDPASVQALQRISKEFRLLGAAVLMENWSAWLAGSPESDQAEGDQLPQPAAAGAGDELLMNQGNAIERFTKDLTRQARDGQIDQVSCRDHEIRQLIDILIRRRQNNPLLVGEAGVGKTAVVEGLALRIATGQVPELLQDVRLLELDIALMQAGASVKGEFENRLKQLIAEVQSSSQPVILFIDEAHTLIGAGGAAGTGDAANLLKPALARGKLRTIAATTWSEYKRYIEKDPALTRRFQTIQVQEPSEEAAMDMLRAVTLQLQNHHKVVVLDEAVQAAVRLSHRYIPARQLPDKAISLLDTACARVAMSQSQAPGEIELLRAGIAKKQQLLLILQQEVEQGYPHGERIAGLQDELQQDLLREAVLQQRWDAEQQLVNSITALTRTLLANEAEAGASATDEEVTVLDRDALREELLALKAELQQLQSDGKLVHPCVDGSAVAGLVADWTGIPVGRMLQDEQDAVLKLAETLGARVLGQDHAMEAISRQIKISRAGLEDPQKPAGVFLLVGPSGVGKTETALALADALYGGEEHLICINMSEFQEPHTVSTLKGAPPGYVGYGEGGVLTEAVRRRPYSVVLLDEIEKAHPDIHEVFYQVFDKGWMEDGEGRFIDFRNTLILMTANVGDERIMSLCEDPELAPPADVIERELRQDLRAVFPAAFLGRVKTVPYYPLSPTLFMRLVAMKLGKVARRLAERHGAELLWDEAVLAWIHARCDQVESGARIIDALINSEVLAPLSITLLSRLGEKPGQIRLAIREGKLELDLVEVQAAQAAGALADEGLHA